MRAAVSVGFTVRPMVSQTLEEPTTRDVSADASETSRHVPSDRNHEPRTAPRGHRNRRGLSPLRAPPCGAGLAAVRENADLRQPVPPHFARQRARTRTYGNRA